MALALSMVRAIPFSSLSLRPVTSPFTAHLMEAVLSQAGVGLPLSEEDGASAFPYHNSIS